MLWENAYLEWMTCLFCGARWSRKTGLDDIQVKMGFITEQHIGRELQNIDRSSRSSCNTTGRKIPTGTATASFVFWHHGSGSTTDNRSDVSRPTAEDRGEEGSSDVAKTQCRRPEQHGSAAERPCVDRQNRC